MHAGTMERLFGLGKCWVAALPKYHSTFPTFSAWYLPPVFYRSQTRGNFRNSHFSLPSSRSILIAVVLCQGVEPAPCRRCGICGAQGECQQVRARSLPTRRCLLLTNPCLIP